MQSQVLGSLGQERLLTLLTLVIIYFKTTLQNILTLGGMILGTQIAF